MNSLLTRRDAIVITGAAAGALLGTARTDAMDPAAAPVTAPRPALTLFSRHLHWTSIEETIEIAASTGYGAISWTVRHGGHVEPHNVAIELPRAVEMTRRAGLGTPMIWTSFSSADSPDIESVVETAAGLGIRTYACDSGPYNMAGDVPAQMDSLRPHIAGLVKLNERYGATSVFHTHAGNGTVGEAVWDIWLLLRDYDPERVAINFDTGYAVMGAGTGWTEAVRFARRHIRSLVLKDFRWVQQDQGGKRRWVAEISPPGEGMVNLEDMLAYFQATGFHGPADVHFEYPLTVPGRAEPINLMGASVGKWKLEIPKAQFIALLKRDAEYYRNLLQQTGLSPALGLTASV